MGGGGDEAFHPLEGGEDSYFDEDMMGGGSLADAESSIADALSLMSTESSGDEFSEADITEPFALERGGEAPVDADTEISLFSVDASMAWKCKKKVFREFIFITI